MDTKKAEQKSIEEHIGGQVQEDLAYLEHVLTNKKEKLKDYSKIKELVESLVETIRPETEQFQTLMNVLLKADVVMVEEFFGQEWDKLPSSCKEIAIKELLAMPSDRGTPRQASVAVKLANTEPKIASKIVYQILSSGKPEPFTYDFKSISKEKKIILRSRFIPKDGQWISLEHPDNTILQTLILFFLDMTDEIEDLGRGRTIGLARNFCKWLINALPRANFDTEKVNMIESRLDKISSRMPSSVSEELRRQETKSSIESNSTGNPEIEEVDRQVSGKTKDGNNVGESPAGEDHQISKKVSENSDESGTMPLFDSKSSDHAINVQNSKSKNLESKDSSNKFSEETSNRKFSKNISDSVSPEQLVKEKKLLRDQLTAEIEVLDELIAERAKLQSKQADIQTKLDLAYEENEQLEQKWKDLRVNFDDIVQTLKRIERERDNAIDLSIRQNQQLSDINKKLKQIESTLEAERAEFEQSSKAEVEFQIKSLKGDIEQKLRHIFENMRACDFDADPDNEKLVTFLRRFLNQIEETLKKFDINP